MLKVSFPKTNNQIHIWRIICTYIYIKEGDNGLRHKNIDFAHKYIVSFRYAPRFPFSISYFINNYIFIFWMWSRSWCVPFLFIFCEHRRRRLLLYWPSLKLPTMKSLEPAILPSLCNIKLKYYCYFHFVSSYSTFIILRLHFLLPL